VDYDTGVTTPSETPPELPGKAQEEAKEAKRPRALQLELPGGKAGPEPSAQGAAERAGRPGDRLRALAVALAVLVVFAALAAAAAVWILPWYVRRQCIEVAAAHGIDLSVDRAQINPEGFRLLGVQATSPDIPGARAQAPELDIETSGLRPQKMTVHGAELVLSGRFGAMDANLAQWRASPSGGQAGAWAPASIVIDGAHLVWQAPLGENVRVEAADVRAEVAWRERDVEGTSPALPGRAPQLELHARSDQVTVAVLGERVLGPWRVDIDRLPDSSRVRVALDPGVPDACTLLVVGDGDTTTSVDVVVPRSPLAHLGVPEQLLGLKAAGLQVEANLHYAALGPARADAKMKGGVYGIVAAGLPQAMDVAWEGTASGDPTAGIDVKRARLAVGPLVGPLTGTLKKFDDGFRLDLAWAAGPVPCAALGASLGLGQPFDIGYELRRVAGAVLSAPAGAVPHRIEGDLSATVMLSFDSRNLGATKVDFTPQIGCRGSFFQ
jgi:hypothetical protein